MKYTHQPIASLKNYEKPREKLLQLGAENLTSAELLALIFGSGSKKNNVIQLSKQVLQIHPLKQWSSQSVNKKLESLHGIGSAKKAQLLACIELARRCQTKNHLPDLLHPRDAFLLLQEYTSKKKEYLVALYLNARNKVIAKQELAVGRINTVSVEPRDIFVGAFHHNAAFFLLAHNHPSGDHTPSPEDEEFANKVDLAAKIMGIQFVDNLVISETGYFSFRERGLLGNEKRSITN